MRRTGRRTYYGWYVLAAISGINFANGATTIGVLTVFVIPLTDEFGWTRTQISAATSIGAILGAVAAPFVGRLTDRLGARIPLAIGGILIVIAVLNLAIMKSLLWFYSAFALARLADQGFVQVSSPPAIASWFLRYRGRAMAVLFFTTSAGGVVLPLLVQLVIELLHWRMAWVMLAGTMLFVGLLPTVMLVRRRPEDMGIRVDGETPARPAAAESSTHMGLASEVNEAQWRLSDALRHPTMWLLLASVFAMGIASTGVGLHLVPYLIERGLTPSIAVGAVSIGFLAAGVGNLVWGLLAERFSSRNLLVFAYLIRAASLVILLMVGDVPFAYLFAVLQGFTEGGLRTLTPVLLAGYYGRHHLGSIFGVNRSIQVAGFAIGPLLSGATFDIARSYDIAFTSFLALTVAGAFLVLFARRPS